MKRILLLLLLITLAAFAGCRASQKPASGAAAIAKTFHLRGKVVSTSPSTGEVTLNHEAIPGFMEAMTMPYKLKDPSILSELHPGDTITADVLVPADENADVLLDHIVIVAQGKPDYKPAAFYHVPAQGDPVPDFALRNQDGKPIHLAQYRGKTLLITFIYTRCPLPNFCPLVTRNFVAIHKSLEADPTLASKAQLLCISFDPDHDTPAVLRAYGAQYLGSDQKSAFDRFEFAAPAKADLDKIAQYFDLGITHDAGDSITHSLSTTLIGPDGKVRKFYPGNEWTPDQIFADIKAL
jgi:protein SCO1/2